VKYTSKSIEGVKYEIKEYPYLRNLVRDVMWNARKKNIVHGIGEVDVSIPRRLIKEIKEKTGNNISFTGYIDYTLAQTVDKHKYMHAIRKKKKLYIFDDVDIATIIEVEIDNHKFPTSYIIRKANKKSLKEISNEIRDAQKKTRKTILVRKLSTFANQPDFIRKAYYRYISKRPIKQKESGGTVGCTAVGMFSEGGGWAIPLTPKTLTVTVGGIIEKPYKSSMGGVEWRDTLCLTFSIDHDIIDGAPATRFINEFCRMLMEGKVLETMCVN
jgi:pyruvate/2-oxoglutarate dehydrogenase complex dihydrolipoamide acyltransferase (E2) component